MKPKMTPLVLIAVNLMIAFAPLAAAESQSAATCAQAGGVDVPSACASALLEGRELGCAEEVEDGDVAWVCYVKWTLTLTVTGGPQACGSAYTEDRSILLPEEDMMCSFMAIGASLRGSVVARYAHARTAELGGAVCAAIAESPLTNRCVPIEDVEVALSSEAPTSIQEVDRLYRQAMGAQGSASRLVSDVEDLVACVLCEG